MTIAAGTPGIELMERAGAAVADAVTRRGGAGTSVTVVCGPGNNGGDGFVAARILREHGMQVRAVLLGAAEELVGDAAIAFTRWRGPVLPVAALEQDAPDLYIDALFGAGLARPLAGDAAKAVAVMNASGREIIALDVPSGLSGDTGRTEGPVVRATETVTFFRLKPGHLLQPGRELCGPVTVADIGISAEVLDPIGAKVFVNEPALWREAWPHHAADTHKFRRGAVAIIAGGIAGVGAPRLSGRAALRIGAGLATILCEPEALSTHAARGPDALMQRAVPDAAALSAFLEDPRVAVAVAGPALGLDLRAAELVKALAAGDKSIVLDADALTLVAGPLGGAAAMLSQRGASTTVLTPHDGEFQRLFGKEPQIAGEASKLERARKAAALANSVVVYKGSDTVIAAPDERAAINVTGSAALATAGSGDVLAGFVGGLLAQGMPAFEAACAAVWLHGRAGEERGLGLIADDLPEAIPPLLRDFS